MGIVFSSFSVFMVLITPSTLQTQGGEQRGGEGRGGGRRMSREAERLPETTEGLRLTISIDSSLTGQLVDFSVNGLVWRFFFNQRFSLYSHIFSFILSLFYYYRPFSRASKKLTHQPRQLIDPNDKNLKAVTHQKILNPS